MQYLKTISHLATCLILGSIALNAQQVLAWGSDGHKTINRAAAQLMTSQDRGFFEANEDNLAMLAVTPDAKWKQPATYNEEKPMHFFQWDRYRQSQIPLKMPIDLSGATSLLGATYINENGSAPWRAAQIYGMLQEALRTKNCSRALQMAGVLGHYIGDLSQPMHNTSDYDGQSIHQAGVHKLFETTLVAQQNLPELLGRVVAAAAQDHGELTTIPLHGQPDDVISLSAKESEMSLGDLPRLLQDFQASPHNNADLIAQFAPLMGRGSYVLAKIWDSASETSMAVQGGIANCPATKLTITEPDWFAIQ